MPNFLVSLSVQVVVEAATLSQAERVAWDERDRLRQHPDARVTSAMALRAMEPSPRAMMQKGA